MTLSVEVGSMNSAANLVVAPQDKCSSSPSTITHTTLFPFCAKHFKSASDLWYHINSVYIPRQEHPAVSYFSLHNYLDHSSLASHWACNKHFVQSGCLRPITGINLVDVQVKTLPLPTNFSSAHLVSAHKSLLMGPGSYDFATLVLYVESSLEFYNHSKELENQAFLQ